MFYKQSSYEEMLMSTLKDFRGCENKSLQSFYIQSWHESLHLSLYNIKVITADIPKLVYLEIFKKLKKNVKK